MWVFIAMEESKEGIIVLQDDICFFYPVLFGAGGHNANNTGIGFRDRDIKSKTKGQWMDAFQIVKRDNKNIGVTYQGFWQQIKQIYEKRGYYCTVIDKRICNEDYGFPKPQLDKMYGFRASQEKLVTEAITQNMSGLIGAPTRYGKTTLMANVLRAYPTLTTCITAPGVDLCKQLHKDLSEGERRVKDRKFHYVDGSHKLKGPLNKGDIVVCSVDSLKNINRNEFRLLLVDESHAMAAPSRTPVLADFSRARRIGFGATLKGRSDGRDPMTTGLFGPVLAEVTYKEAVAEGAICPLEVLFLDVEYMPKPKKVHRDHNATYEDVLYLNDIVAEKIRQISNEIIHPDLQTLIFIRTEKQAEYLRDVIGRDITVAMAKNMNATEREEVAQLLRNNIIKRCLCSKIYVQGVTFNDVRVLINAEGGGYNTSAIQKPGRLAEIRPGKKCGIMIDLFFKPMPGINLRSPVLSQSYWDDPWKDSQNRETAFKEIGYNIKHCKDIATLRSEFNKLI